MKNFIEFTMDNGMNVTISISSISADEELKQSRCKIILKETIEQSGINIEVMPKMSYSAIKKLMSEAIL